MQELVTQYGLIGFLVLWVVREVLPVYYRHKSGAVEQKPQPCASGDLATRADVAHIETRLDGVDSALSCVKKDLQEVRDWMLRHQGAEAVGGE